MKKQEVLESLQRFGYATDANGSPQHSKDYQSFKLMYQDYAKRVMETLKREPGIGKTEPIIRPMVTFVTSLVETHVDSEWKYDAVHQTMVQGLEDLRRLYTRPPRPRHGVPGSTQSAPQGVHDGSL